MLTAAFERRPPGSSGIAFTEESNFFLCQLDDITLRMDFTQSLRCLRLVQAIRESILNGKMAQRVPLHLSLLSVHHGVQALSDLSRRDRCSPTRDSVIKTLPAQLMPNSGPAACIRLVNVLLNYACASSTSMQDVCPIRMGILRGSPCVRAQASALRLSRQKSILIKVQSRKILF